VGDWRAGGLGSCWRQGCRWRFGRSTTRPERSGGSGTCAPTCASGARVGTAVARRARPRGSSGGGARTGASGNSGRLRAPWPGWPAGGSASRRGRHMRPSGAGSHRFRLAGMHAPRLRCGRTSNGPAPRGRPLTAPEELVRSPAGILPDGAAHDHPSGHFAGVEEPCTAPGAIRVRPQAASVHPRPLLGLVGPARDAHLRPVLRCRGAATPHSPLATSHSP